MIDEDLWDCFLLWLAGKDTGNVVSDEYKLVCGSGADFWIWIPHIDCEQFLFCKTQRWIDSGAGVDYHWLAPCLAVVMADSEDQGRTWPPQAWTIAEIL